MKNAIPDNRPGPTTNPLLIVNTGQDGNSNSFITPTLVTNHQNCQGNRNTVAFENTIPETDKQINARLIKIANQGPSLETMGTIHLDHHIPDRHQYTNHMESTSIRVCTTIKIDPTITIITKTTGRHGKTIPTEHATIVVQRDT